MRLFSWDDAAVKVRVTLGATIVELPDTEYGSMRQLAIERVADALTRLIDQPRTTRLIVDLSKVEFLGARLIGALVNARHRLKRHDRHLVLCGLTPRCAKLAQVLSLERLFDIFPTLRMALRVVIRDTTQSIKRGATIRTRIAISDVAWDRDKVRLEYLTDNDSAIYTRIVSRKHTEAICG